MKFNKNHELKIYERGDNYIYIGTYERYEKTIDKDIVNKNSDYVRIKCPYCDKEYDIKLSSFVSGNKSKCKFCCNEYKNSFAYYVQQELKEPLNKYWDWEKNTVNPYHISKGKHIKVWIKCDRVDYHGSYSIYTNSFLQGSRCGYCNPFASHKVHPKDSFAQYHIDNTDPNFLEKYWSDKNTLNPWELAPRSTKKVWIKCQEKDYHGDYKVSCAHFTGSDDVKPTRCPQCSSQKIHPKDSFGSLYPDKAKYWDYKSNDKSPYEIAPKSKLKYWFICDKCGESFKRSLVSLNSHDVGVKCRNCTCSAGEYKIYKYLINNGFIKYEDFTTQNTFNNLYGTNNGLLSYDFYINKLNLLIEYQGKQHEKFCKSVHKTKEGFEKQIEHDRRKFNYAIKNNIDIIYIYYWQYDEIEEILNYELN